MYATDYEKEQTEKNIAIGMQEQLLTMKDVFYIRNIKNYKLQQLYLATTTEKNKREAQQAQQQNIQQTAQVQQQSAAQAAQQQLSIEQMKHQMAMELEQTKDRSAKEKSLIDGLFSVLSKTGGEIPTVLQPLASQVFQNVAMDLVLDNAQTKMAIGQAMQQVQAQQKQAAEESQEQPQQESQEQEPQQ